LQALCDAAVQVGGVVVVAPTAALSGCSHRVTTSQPLRLVRHGERRCAVDGTPADCVRVALHQLVRERVWILSGVNAGGNLGADVYHSGTVAAVREGALHGCPGIAFSQYLRRGLPEDWGRAARWVVPILREILERDWRPG